MGRGVWQATVHSVAESDLTESTYAHTHTYTYTHTLTHTHTYFLILILSVLDKAYNLELKCTLQLIYTKFHLIAKENELKNEELSNPGAPSSLQG